MKSLPDGIVVIMKLENWLQVSYIIFFLLGIFLEVAPY